MGRLGTSGAGSSGFLGFEGCRRVRLKGGYGLGFGVSGFGFRV